MARLRLEVGRYRELVFGRVLEQSEDLTREGVIAVGSASDFKLRSGTVPELQLRALFVRGTAIDADERMFYRLFPTKDLAKDAVAAIRTLVRTVNGLADKDVPGHAVIEIME